MNNINSLKDFSIDRCVICDGKLQKLLQKLPHQNKWLFCKDKDHKYHITQAKDDAEIYFYDNNTNIEHCFEYYQDQHNRLWQRSNKTIDWELVLDNLPFIPPHRLQQKIQTLVNFS